MPLGLTNGMRMLGCGEIVPQTPGYYSRLAQPVPGSLTRPHMPPIERGFTFMRELRRRNGGVGPIRHDGCKSHPTDARRLAGQDVCTKLTVLELQLRGSTPPTAY
jgi:hypothetical protein